MLEFESLVYLDVQKTGSRYIKRFLRRFVASREVASTNGLPRESRKEGALHVISTRHPLSQYVSLYSYGCEGKGGLRNHMNRDGRSNLYDGTQAGFTRWLELTLSLESPYAGNRRFGFQSVRFLTLALPGCRKISSTAEDRTELRELLSKHGMMDVVLRQETLNDDLLLLTCGQHAHLFRDRALIPSYLSEANRINASSSLHIDPAALPAELLSTLRAREWLFFDLLSYR